MVRSAGNPQVKSAVRALAVLQLFEQLRRGATAKEIGEQLQMPISSTSMLLRTMLGQGYLEFDQSTHTYHPTLRVLSLGHWMTEDAGRPTAAMIHLTEELHRKTGQLVAVGARKGLYAQYVYVIPSVEPAPYEVRNGAIYPLARSTCGWALLARCENHEISRIVGRCNREVLPEPVEPGWLLGEIDRVRETGYAVSFGQVRPSSGAVSMPLPDTVHDAALVIGGMGQRFIEHTDEYLDVMREGIRQYFGTPEISPQARH